jgi:hypothetical protein
MTLRYGELRASQGPWPHACFSRPAELLASVVFRHCPPMAAGPRRHLHSYPLPRPPSVAPTAPCARLSLLVQLLFPRYGSSYPIILFIPPHQPPSPHQRRSSRSTASSLFNTYLSPAAVHCCLSLRPAGLVRFASASALLPPVSFHHFFLNFSTTSPLTCSALSIHTGLFTRSTHSFTSSPPCDAFTVTTSQHCRPGIKRCSPVYPIVNISLR